MNVPPLGAERERVGRGAVSRPLLTRDKVIRSGVSVIARAESVHRRESVSKNVRDEIGRESVISVVGWWEAGWVMSIARWGKEGRMSEGVGFIVERGWRCFIDSGERMRNLRPQQSAAYRTYHERTHLVYLHPSETHPPFPSHITVS